MKLPWCIEAEKRRIEEEERRIAQEKAMFHTDDMEVGDWGYIIGWAFDYEKRVPFYNTIVHPISYGTASLKIFKFDDNTFSYWPESYKKEYSCKAQGRLSVATKKWYEFWK